MFMFIPARKVGNEVIARRCVIPGYLQVTMRKKKNNSADLNPLFTHGQLASWLAGYTPSESADRRHLRFTHTERLFYEADEI